MKFDSTNGAWFDQYEIQEACHKWIVAADKAIHEEREECISELIEKSKQVRKKIFGIQINKELTREEARTQLKKLGDSSFYTRWEIPYLRTSKSRGEVRALLALCNVPCVDNKVFVNSATMLIIGEYVDGYKQTSK